MIETLSSLGRYKSIIEPLLKYYSSRSWIKYRLKVEILYFHFLYIQLKELEENIPKDKLEQFINIYPIIDQLTDQVIVAQKTTKDDIEAIKIVIRKYYDKIELAPSKYKEYIHFGLTSNDIHSIAFSLQLQGSILNYMIPKFDNLQNILSEKSNIWKNITMISKIQGKVIIPTTLGKEIDVFIERFDLCISKLKKFIYYAKIGGKAGTLAAHYTMFPNINWAEQLNHFCNEIGLVRWITTSSSTNYEDIIELSQILIRVNNILIDLCLKFRMYINEKVFIIEKFKTIDFESPEENLRLANQGFKLCIEILPISKLQGDTSNHSILRNYGNNLGYLLVAINCIEIEINQLNPDYNEITGELNKHPEILTEAFECLLMKYEIENREEKIKKIIEKGKFINLDHLKRRIIKELENNMTEELREEILNLKYDDYLGYLSMISS